MINASIKAVATNEFDFLCMRVCRIRNLGINGSTLVMTMSSSA